MIAIVGIISGILNGLFASGAGQIIVFYFIFILKKDSHKIRFTSLSILSITSIVSLYNFREYINFDFKFLIFFILLSVIGCIIGSSIMKKIEGNILNLISGIILIIFSVISFFR